MQLLLNLILVFVMSLMLISCEYKNGSDEGHFESLIVEYSFSEKKYNLVKKKLYSLEAPRSLDSQVAKFYYKASSGVDLDFESPVQVNMIKTSDNLYVAKDISSLKSISSYKIYEDYYNLHKRLGILTYSVWPKKVVVDGVDGSRKNNAFHVPSKTSTFYLPFDPKAVPASLNPGVVAHEESHGLFFTQVLKGSVSEDLYVANTALLKIRHGSVNKCYRDMTCGDLKSFYKKTEELISLVDSEIFKSKVDNMEYNHVILRALDEGVADYAGFVFSKAPNSLAFTLGFESEREAFSRVVGSSMNQPLPTVDQLQAIIDQVKGEKNININTLPENYQKLSESTASLLPLSYKMAGQVSSLLNMLSESIDYSDMPANLSKQEYFLKLLTESLANMKKVVFEKYSSAEKKISFDDFFKSILKNEIVTTETCEILSAWTSDEITTEGCLK